MQADSVYLLKTLSELYVQRIDVYHSSAIQLQDTLIQLRVLTLAIVVGAAVLSKQIGIDTWWKPTIALFLFTLILAAPFSYDLFTHDQQMRRSKSVNAFVDSLKILPDLSYLELKAHIPPKGKDVDTIVTKESSERWVNRWEQRKAWQCVWYVWCWLIGLAILFVGPITREKECSEKEPSKEERTRRQKIYIFLIIFAGVMLLLIYP